MGGAGERGGYDRKQAENLLGGVGVFEIERDTMEFEYSFCVGPGAVRE